MHVCAWGAWEQERVHVCVHGLPSSCLLGPGAHLGWHTSACKEKAITATGGDTDTPPFWFLVKKMRQDPD